MGIPVSIPTASTFGNDIAKKSVLCPNPQPISKILLGLKFGAFESAHEAIAFPPPSVNLTKAPPQTNPNHNLPHLKRLLRIILYDNS